MILEIRSFQANSASRHFRRSPTISGFAFIFVSKGRLRPRSLQRDPGLVHESTDVTGRESNIKHLNEGVLSENATLREHSDNLERMPLHQGSTAIRQQKED